MNTPTRIVARALLPLALAALAGFAAFGCQPRRRAEAPPPPPKLHLRKEIDHLLEAGAPATADTAEARELWPALAAYYEKHHDHAVWVDDDHPRETTGPWVDAIAHADRFGLDPSNYHAADLVAAYALATRSDTTTAWLRPRHLAQFDVAATFALLQMAADLRFGRVRGDTLDSDWTRREPREFWNDLIERARRDPPDTVLATLVPGLEGYQRLAGALATYRTVSAAGGWREIPAGPPLTAGARGPRVALLVRRLAATGELPYAVTDTMMDDRLMHAVGDFQTRNGIPRSGTVGEATRAVLNVPVQQRIRTLALNLERWRWLPDSLGRRRVEVNIPAFKLDLIDSGRVQRTMRVVVGKRTSPTPVFSDVLTYLELNPSWTVPPSVVFKEIIPAMKGKVDYLLRNRMIVVPLSNSNRADTLDPRLVPWKKVSPDTFPYLVIQKAGPDNPLGSIKLMCPNEYDVYLHDTPRREKFADAVRDYSHGCVRVSGAIELADSLLGVAPPDTAQLDSLIATGQWRRLRLPRPVPVHFLYWTAWADSAGAVHWRPDLYGVDDRLDQALRSHDVPPFALNPGVSRSPYWMAAEMQARAKQQAKAGKGTLAVPVSH